MNNHSSPDSELTDFSGFLSHFTVNSKNTQRSKESFLELPATLDCPGLECDGWLTMYYKEGDPTQSPKENYHDNNNENYRDNYHDKDKDHDNDNYHHKYHDSYHDKDKDKDKESLRGQKCLVLPCKKI